MSVSKMSAVSDCNRFPVPYLHRGRFCRQVHSFPLLTVSIPTVFPQFHLLSLAGAGHRKVTITPKAVKSTSNPVTWERSGRDYSIGRNVLGARSAQRRIHPSINPSILFGIHTTPQAKLKRGGRKGRGERTAKLARV